MIPTEIIHRVQTQGTVILRGAAALQSLRAAIRLAAKRLDLSFSVDPSSDPDLVDYLGVIGADVVDNALDMAILGLLLGSLIGQPAPGIAIGAAIGAGIGVGRGLDRVVAGWRIVTRRDRHGNPFAMISPGA